MERIVRSLAVLLVLAAAGCSRESPPTAAPAPADAGTTNPLEVPGAYLEGVVGAKFESERKLWLADLRQRIQAFEIANDRKPASLEELARQAPLPKLAHFMEFKYDPQSGEIDIVRKDGK